MQRRGVHLVGSIPAEGAAEAMHTATHNVGQHLRTLPDGEPGERRDWIVHIVESFRRNPHLRVRADGDWSDYEQTPTFRIRPGHTLRGYALELGQHEAFTEGYPVFQRVRDELGRDDLTFQVGIPGPLDMALFTFGPREAFLRRGPFAEAALREIHQIHARAGDDVIFQLEVPVELVFVTKMPGGLRQPMAAFLAGGLARLVRHTPPGARFGIHLCVGDLGNKALEQPRDAGPLVTLANEIARRWPTSHPLEYVHAPMAAGDDPAPFDEAFYQPLRGLRLPPQVRFAAGFVHERRELDENHRVLDIIEHHAGRPVDVAAACGLGRRDPESAREVLKQSAELCQSG